MLRSRLALKYTLGQRTILYGTMSSISTLILMLGVLEFKYESLPILFLVFTGVLIIAIAACIYYQFKNWKNQDYFKKATNIAIYIMLFYMVVFVVVAV